MGKFLMRMEQKYGKYAPDNLPLLLVACSGIGYLLQMVMPGLTEYIYLNPYLILHGEIWRLFTWVLVPDGGFGGGIGGMFMMAFVLYCYYILGSNLQFAMGKFRFSLYIFSGLLFTVIGGFVLYGVASMQFAPVIEYLGENGTNDVFTIYGTVVLDGQTVMLPSYWFRQVSTSEIKMSMLLAIAAIYPDSVFRINFLIPIKAKWLGIFYAGVMIYSFLMGDISTRILLVSSLLNFIVFFFATRDYRRISPKEQMRKMEYRQKVRQAKQAGNTTTYQGKNVITRHKCAICGKTELDDENLEFRYCSKCEGNYEYCSEHLYTHEHVRRIVPRQEIKPEER